VSRLIRFEPFTVPWRHGRLFVVSASFAEQFVGGRIEHFVGIELSVGLFLIFRTFDIHSIHIMLGPRPSLYNTVCDIRLPSRSEEDILRIPLREEVIYSLGRQALKTELGNVLFTKTFRA